MTCGKCGGLVVEGEEPGEQRCVLCGWRRFAPWKDLMPRAQPKCPAKWCRENVADGSRYCARHQALDQRAAILEDLRTVERQLELDLVMIRRAIHGVERLSQ